jgi:hypothetical protein
MTHSIQVASHPDYERLVVEVHIDGAFVCLLSQEDGVEEPVIEFDASGVAVKFDLSEFEIALAAAKARMSELDRDG